MKLNITQKCQAIGSLFLLVVTGLEVAMLLYAFDLNIFSGRSIAIVITASVFNAMIWWFATKYQTTKEYLEREENEHTDR